MIAQRTKDGTLEGRYHHWDAYPRGLGKALWDAYHGHFDRDWVAMVALMIDDHPAGWSTICGADLSMSPGFRENTTLIDFDKPHGPECYCHGDRSQEAQPPMVCGCLIGDTHTCGKGFWIEWIYAIGEEGMEVYFYRELPSGTMAHVLVDVIEWGGSEPDWNEINRIAYEGEK